MDNVCYLLLYTQCVNNVSVYVRLNFHTNSNGGKRTHRERGNKKVDIISMYN